MNTEWHEARRSRLGATDVAAICGVHPWRSAAQTWAEKKGLTEPEEETAIMRRGKRLEPYILLCWADHTGYDLTYATAWPQDKPKIHDQHSFLAVTPDVIYDDPNEEGAHFAIELKSHSPFVAASYGPPDSDEAPAHEIVQATWQCRLLGLKRCEIAVLFGVDDFRTYSIDYDEEFGAELEAMAVQWWTDYVLADRPPPITGSEADSKLLGRLYPEDRGGVVFASAEMEEQVTLLRKARKERKHWEDEEESLRNSICQFMGDAAYLESAQGKITWKLAAPSTQWKGVAQALAQRFGISAREMEALEALHKGQASRRFTVPRGW